MTVSHIARIEASANGLTAGQVKEFVADLPPSAEISAVMRDRGTQRDPEHYLFALTARWET